MKLSNLNRIAIALAASASFTGTAHAGIYGASSDTSEVVVGTSAVNGGPHVSGRPGIAVPATGLSNLVDFQGLQSSVGTDGNGVSTINAGTSVPTDHSNLGVFHFAKVGSANLYFGEWSQTGSIANSGSGYAVNIGTTTIAGTNFAGAGATATQSGSTVASSGIVSGRFFGANAAALAGIVNFSSGRQYNTAFGGTKN
jgi:hypothetical protein